jgi:dihydroorotate dehydrogenase (NAD+) catalytic subunit
MNSEYAAPKPEFSHPLMNAAGSLGFAPDARGLVDLSRFGAFVTNPISARAHKVANPPMMLPFPGGALLHTGHPNPGLSSAIKQHAAAWARSEVPIIIHLISNKPEEVRNAVLRVEGLENVIAVELGIESDNAPDSTADLVQAAIGELPVIAQMPLLRTMEVAQIVVDAGASIVSLGAPRGSLPDAKGKLVSGRLYGPAIFPLALEAVKQLSQAGHTVIGAGGIESEDQANAMIAAGAMAVQVDVSLWKGKFSG